MRDAAVFCYSAVGFLFGMRHLMHSMERTNVPPPMLALQMPIAMVISVTWPVSVPLVELTKYKF